MVPFVVIAASMTLFAVMAVVWPLVRRGNRRILTGAITAVVIVCAAAALYSLWSTWDWKAAPTQARVPPEVGAMVAKLEQKLATDSNNLEGWLMLGRSYLALERFDDAATAYDRAVKLSGGRRADAYLGFGEALSLGAGGEITAPAADAFERAIRLEPENPKGLLFGGFAAVARGDNFLARDRWLRLKALNPPPQIMQMLDSHLAALAAVPSGAATAQTAASGEANVTIRITPELKSRVRSDMPLFVFAREPGAQGPPLAVKKLSAAVLGSTIKLSAADAMMSGRSLQTGHNVAITARISFSGQPLPSAGDLYGELTYDVGKDGVRELVIDRVVH